MQLLRIASLALVTCMTCVFLFTSAEPSFAQSAASSVFDFGPLVSETIAFLAPTVATVLGLVGMWVLQRLARFLGLKIDAGHRATVEQGLDRAIGYAIDRVGSIPIGGIPIDMKYSAVEHAASYAQRRIPDALKHFGITPTALAEMIESRLEGLVVDPLQEDVGGLRPVRARLAPVPA